MTHEEALNKILSHSCSNPAYHPDDGIKKYEIDLCCEKLLVIAQPKGDMKYDIIDVKTRGKAVDL